MNLPVNKGGHHTSNAEDDADPATKPYDLEAVRWLRARRAIITDRKQLAEFDTELQALGTDISTRRGNTVGVAIAITAGAIVLAIVAVIVGLFVMDAASKLIGSISN